MPEKSKDAELRRMAKIRKIAGGIFDEAERRAVLALVADHERLVGLKEPKVSPVATIRH